MALAAAEENEDADASSAAVAATEDIDPKPRDPLDRFRLYKKSPGGQPKLHDQRRHWADPMRELEAYDDLSRGTRKCRRRFWQRMADARYPHNPVAAIRYALEIYRGPLPELETAEEFNAYWNPDRLKEIADRWQKCPIHPHYAASQSRRTEEIFMAAQPRAAAEAVTRAFSPNTSERDRVQYLKLVLSTMPKNVRIEGLVDGLKPANAEQVLLRTIELAVKMQDTERVRLLADLLEKWQASHSKTGPTTQRPRLVRFVQPERAADETAGAIDVHIPDPPPPPAADLSTGDDVEPSRITGASDPSSDIEAFLDDVIDVTPRSR